MLVKRGLDVTFTAAALKLLCPLIITMKDGPEAQRLP